QIVALGREIRDDTIQWTGFALRGFALLNLGRLTDCLEDRERALPLLSPEVSAAALRMLGHDAYTYTLVPGGFVQWLQGNPNRALETARLLLEKGTQAHNSLTHALALTYITIMRIYRREPEEALAPGRAAVELTERYGYDGYLAWTQQHLGLAY